MMADNDGSEVIETKNSGIYCMAGRRIEIHSLYPYVQEYCKDYRSSGPAEIRVVVTQADIDLEREKGERADNEKGITGRHYPDPYLETLAVYRQIAERMPFYDTFLMHGSAIAVDGQGYLFGAKSGTGKSTHARLWREMLGDMAQMVNDDKPLIHAGEDGIVVYGTPWNGKHRLGCSMSAPLAAICFLTRGVTNEIHPISAAEAYQDLIRQTYVPADPEALVRTLRLLDKVSAGVRFYRLSCNMEPEAAKVAYEMMRKKTL